MSSIQKSGYTCLLALFFSGALSAQEIAADSTGLPGDNFSLQGAIETFQKSTSPEQFEQLLNREDNHVNNLDLNGDGETDFIKVIDKQDGDVHAFILQAMISETESQDVAVIEIEKTGAETAVLQIVGDEDLYGEETIIEPQEDNDKSFMIQETDAFAGGPSINIASRLIVNVWFWPSVRYIYAPGYVVYRSAWRWRAYPGWWRPWRPVRWAAFHPYYRPVYSRYAVVNTHRIVRARTIYRPVRVSSVTVRTRNQAAVYNYRVTRTRTSVTGPRGNNRVRKTTTVQGPRGNKATRTRVRRRSR